MQVYVLKKASTSETLGTFCVFEHAIKCLIAVSGDESSFAEYLTFQCSSLPASGKLVLKSRHRGTDEDTYTITVQHCSYIVGINPPTVVIKEVVGVVPYDEQTLSIEGMLAAIQRYNASKT